MSSAAEPQRRRHSLSDWLALHDLDRATCRHVLDAIAHDFADDACVCDGGEPGYQAPDPEIAWLKVIKALRDFLPEQQGIIDDTFANTGRMIVDRPGTSRKAVTLDNGPEAYPTILFTYRGQPAEHLVMAHEFGHALQIRASRGKPVPPVVREVCAFLGESALLSFARRYDAPQHARLVQAWRKDSHRYFGVQSDRLRAALATPAAPYAYSWNYPIARHLSIRIFEQWSQDQIWSIFEGRTSTQEILRGLA